VPEDLSGLASLEGAVVATFSAGEKQLRIDNVAGDGPKVASADGITLTVAGVSPRAGWRRVVNLKVRLAPNAAPLLWHSEDGRCGFFLVDGSWKRYPGTVSALEGREEEKDPAAPPDLVEPKAGDLSVELEFAGLPEEGPLALLVVYPASLQTQEYPFAMRNVPFSVGKPARGKAEVSAHAGPLIVTLAEAESSQYFRFAAFPFGLVEDRGRWLNCTFNCSCEGGQSLVLSRTALSSILTPDGDDLLQGPEVFFLDLHCSGIMSGAGTVTDWSAWDRAPEPGSIELRVWEVPRDLERLAEVKGTFSALFGHGRKELRMDLPDCVGKPVVTDDGVALTVTEAKCEGRSHQFKVRAKGTREGATFLPYGFHATCGFFLVAPDGKRYSLSSRGTSVETAAEPEINVGEEFVAGEMRLTFDDLPDLPGKWSLLYVYPDKTERRQYTFVVKDVPAP
jgi:hypothetical protein